MECARFKIVVWKSSSGTDRAPLNQFGQPAFNIPTSMEERPVSNRQIAFSLAAAIGLAACQQQAANDSTVNDSANATMTEPAIQPMTAQLLDGAGKAIGDIQVSEDANGVTLRVSAAGLPQGAHGVHLHEIGKCDTPDFKSAGAHWNPASKQHGRDNPMGAHLGDLANFDIGSGPASTSYLVGAVKMSGAENALADADGTSLVIHAKADDYKTNPSGDSGDRIACAVLAPAQGG
jgi:Cu-Zn family superoxide dismutase